MTNININLKKQRELLSNNTIQEKINFIDHIVWINLNRAPIRKNNMEKLLNKLFINNTRIEAIDGKDDKVINNLEFNKLKKGASLNNYEIACVLSHIKAINYLSNIDGDYFLVCEDDIDFFNTQYFTKTLENIIKECPYDFDILQIAKTQEISFEKKNLYEKYNRTWGAFAYIITKKAVKKLVEFANYNFENNNFNINIPLKVSELFIFQNLNTYTYKYNFINTLNVDSSIHNNHLLWHRKCSLIGLYDVLINLENI